MAARDIDSEAPAEPAGASAASTTQLIVVRHGESSGNLAAARAEERGDEMIAIDVRDADVPLSQTGITQAVALGHGLAAMSAHLMPTRV